MITILHRWKLIQYLIVENSTIIFIYKILQLLGFVRFLPKKRYNSNLMSKVGHFGTKFDPISCQKNFLYTTNGYIINKTNYNMLYMLSS